MKRRIACVIFVLVVGLQSVVLQDSQWKEVRFAFLGLACGLILAAVHVPESGVERTERKDSLRRRVLGCMAICLLTAYAASYPWHSLPSPATPYGGSDSACPLSPLCAEVFDRRWVNLGMLTSLGALLITCLMKEHPPSTNAHDAKWCVFGIWLTAMCFQLFEVAKAVENVAGDADKFKDFSLMLGMGMEAVVLGWTVAAFQSRMSALRVSNSKVPCFTKTWVFIMSVSLVANAAMNAFRRGFDSVPAKICNTLFLVVFLAIWGTYTAKVFSTLMKGINVLHFEIDQKSDGRHSLRGLARRQTIWAAKVLRTEAWICFLLGVSTFLAWLCVLGIRIYELVDGDGYKANRRLLWFWVGALRRYDLLGNAIGLAILSGVLWQGKPPGVDAEDIDVSRRSRERLGTSMSDHLDCDHKVLYHEKVKQLAERGISIESLLALWEKLLDGEMVNFDPRRSRTNDVVRQAIIPMTRDGSGGVALSTLWEEPAPQTMVTHNWSNTFSHLVAAVLADAMGKSTYSAVVESLCSKAGLQKLHSQLRSEQLHASYWICAMCVNQHASICDGFGSEPAANSDAWNAWDLLRRDSVTGSRFEACNCCEPKLRGKDATSVALTEMNKFDDMMAHMSETDGVGQLVVVDEAFDVLTRAWCVAEIVEGNHLSANETFSMRIQVFSQHSVDLHYDRLTCLTVDNCMASSPEDREYILSKIVNKTEFNLKLQELVFGAQCIFKGWVDGRDRSRMVGRIWRRCATSTLHQEDELTRSLTERPTFRRLFSKMPEADSDSDTDVV